jgi:hypothetical protein
LSGTLDARLGNLPGHSPCAQVIAKNEPVSSVLEDVALDAAHPARTQATKPPTKREIHRGAGIKNRKDTHAAVDALVESGVIVEVERRSNGAGHPAKAYKLAEE